MFSLHQLFSVTDERPRLQVRRARLEAPTCPAIERLRPLLHAAAELDLDDRDGWQRLCEAAYEVTGGLVAGRQLPAHLAVAVDHPPVVVARTLAAAWRHVTSPWPQRHHRS